jgi:hypothetical protein
MNDMTSRAMVGEVVYFQPVIRKADTKEVDDSAVPCRVTGVSLPDGDGGFYDVFPIRGVDSYFVLRGPAP